MSYTTGTTMYNPYVVNIIDLQGGQQSASGISITDTVDQLTQMVDFPTKTISVDNINNYSGNAINVNSEIQFNNDATFLGPINISGTGGGASFSNADGSAYQMNIYGTLITSNLLVLSTTTSATVNATSINANSISVDTINSATTPLTVNTSTIVNGSMYVAPAAPGEAIFGASGVSSFELKVYGSVYSSNYNSLCPMKFRVHDLSGIEFEAMRITELGNVGIGTFAPTERLVVDGTIKNTGNVVVGGSMDITGDVIIRGNLRVLGSITNN